MKVLVIRFTGIGDAILSHSICHSVKHSMPEAQVDFLTYAPSCSLFTASEWVDNVLCISKEQRKNPMRFWGLALRIARSRYDIILDVSANNGKGELISFLSWRSKWRIGRPKRKWKRFCYSHVVDDNPLFDKLAQKLDMLNPLIDAGFAIEKKRTFTIEISAQEQQATRERMHAMGIDFSRPVFVLAVSASIEHKKWQQAHWCAVAKYCLQTYDAQLVLFAGNDKEKRDITAFHQAMDAHPDIYSGIETDSIYALGAVLRQCDMFIGNEGGPRHLAQAVGIPSVAVFSPSAPMQEWLPYVENFAEGVSWQQVDAGQNGDFENFQDARYWALYHLIMPKHLIPLVDKVYQANGGK